MCMPSDPDTFLTLQKKRPKRCKVRVHQLSRKTRYEENIGKDMLLKNLKLYIENMSILEENEKLRKKASLLHQENLQLMTEIQKKKSQIDSTVSTSPTAKNDD